jgi:transposase
VLLFTDWTLLRLFPPLRAMWATIGTQAKVAITGQNAKRVLFGTINVRTAHRTVYIGRNAGAHEVRAFLLVLRKAYRRAGTIWLLADRASGHTAQATLALAEELGIEFVWLPRQWPELNAMDQLWKELKRDVAANRQAASIDDLAERASQWVLDLTPAQARRKSGMASSRFWLRSLSQDFWLPT